jgi:hypothetical protein
MATSRQGDLFRHPSAPAQARFTFRPVNSARRSRDEARSMAGGLLPLAIVLVAVALGLVWMRLRYTEIAYRLATLRQVIVGLEDDRRDLAVAVAAAEAPAELERAARDLGMVPPTVAAELPLR